MKWNSATNETTAIPHIIRFRRTRAPIFSRAIATIASTAALSPSNTAENPGRVPQMT